MTGQARTVYTHEGPGDVVLIDRVVCYAGYRGEETPRRFHLGQRCVEVAEVLDRWLAPDHRYFKLRGDDGATYVLRHDERADSWELTVYEAGPG